jgi:hypothetical protein
VAGFALAQFGLGWSPVAQIGLCVSEGRGQLVASLGHLGVG